MEKQQNENQKRIHSCTLFGNQNIIVAEKLKPTITRHQNLVRKAEHNEIEDQVNAKICLELFFVFFMLIL